MRTEVAGKVVEGVQGKQDIDSMNQINEGEFGEETLQGH